VIEEKPNALFQWGFAWTSRVLAYRKFSKVVFDSTSPIDFSSTLWKDPRPIFFYSTHESFWDPILAADISVLRCKRRCVAPMAAEQLRKFKSLKRVGIFGVEDGAATAAKEFIDSHIAQSVRPAVWVTPQGCFVPDSTKQPTFKTGLSYWSLSRDCIRIPVAICYSSDLSPLVSVRLGSPEDVVGRSLEYLKDKLELEKDAGRLRVQLESVVRDLKASRSFEKLI